MTLTTVCCAATLPNAKTCMLILAFFICSLKRWATIIKIKTWNFCTCWHSPFLFVAGTAHYLFAIVLIVVALLICTFLFTLCISTFPRISFYVCNRKMYETYGVLIIQNRYILVNSGFKRYMHSVQLTLSCICRIPI